jgi:hypothetical protein
MSHQIKRLSCALLTAGRAGGNFRSTIYAQSSACGPAATPGPTSKQAAKAGALAHHVPNPLSRRAARYRAAASAVDSRTRKAAEAGEIIRCGWPVLDRDKRKLPNLRKAAPPRSTRAILIGWLLGPPQTGEARCACERNDQSNPSHGVEQAPFGHSVGPAWKLDAAHRKVGSLD